MCMDDIEAWGKRPLLVCSWNAGGWYKLLQIIENLSSYTNRLICDPLGMRAVERSYPRSLAGRLFYRLCLRGICYCDKDASGASRYYGAVYQASMQPSANVDSLVQTFITESGLSYKPMIVIFHIREITAILCPLLTIPEYILMVISLFGQILKQVINGYKYAIFVYYLHFFCYI